jgi:RNA polymerase subunit RPABC4/transcription elongation factor Spt4
MRPAPASRTTEMRSPMHQQPYKIVLFPLVPGVVLVVCQRCQQIVVACPDCGYELGRSRDQAQAEQAGERRRCPVCRSEQATEEVA